MKKALIFSGLIFSLLCTVHANGGEEWKDKYFKMHPEADTNQDGELSWPEYKEFKAKKDAKSKDPQSDAEQWKNEYFTKHPEADTNKDGKLSWSEYKAHKKKQDNADF